MADAPILQLRGISKHFGSVEALSDVDFEVREGEVMALVGDNGAGKSTLVKIISGIHQPDGGELWLGDEQLKGLTPPRARELGIETVYQDLALCENLDAVSNVVLGQEPTFFTLGPLGIVDRRAASRIARASRTRLST